MLAKVRPLYTIFTFIAKQPPLKRRSNVLIQSVFPIERMARESGGGAPHSLRVKRKELGGGRGPTVVTLLIQHKPFPRSRV